MLYPNWKEAVKIITESDETIFYSDEDISELLDEPISSDKYRFNLMHLKSYLLYEKGIDFIRSESPTQGKGYKIATDSEKVNITMDRLHRRIRNAAARCSEVISITDPVQITDTEKKLLDHHSGRNGMLLAFLHKTARKLPAEILTISVPKIAEIE